MIGKTLRKLRERVARLFHREQPDKISEEAIVEYKRIERQPTIGERLEAQQERLVRERWLPEPKPKPRVRRVRGRGHGLPKPKSKAVHADISRFMKGSKHQHKWYRRSVRAKIDPED